MSEAEAQAPSENMCAGRTQAGVPRPSVFRIPELFERILSYTSKSTKARGARACRQWSVVCLKALWSTMDSVTPILTLLSPRPSLLVSLLPCFYIKI